MRWVPGCEELQDGGQVAGELFVEEALAAFVHQAAERVIAVQINPSHNLHGGSPVVEVLVCVFESHLKLSTPPLGDHPFASSRLMLYSSWYCSLRLDTFNRSSNVQWSG
jgi:hypothetical protein